MLLSPNDFVHHSHAKNRFCIVSLFEPLFILDSYTEGSFLLCLHVPYIHSVNKDVYDCSPFRRFVFQFILTAHVVVLLLLVLCQSKVCTGDFKKCEFI